MRRSELALVIIRLNIGSTPHLVLTRHRKWGDWTLVGGHMEPEDRHNWARTAARECNEELAPLEHGRDFILLPLLDQPMRWGPIPSRSAGGEPTLYVAQVFTLRFLRSPSECLARLPAGEFKIVPEADVVAVHGTDDEMPLTVRALRSVERTAVAWDPRLSSAPAIS